MCVCVCLRASVRPCVIYLAHWIVRPAGFSQSEHLESSTTCVSASRASASWSRSTLIKNLLAGPLQAHCWCFLQNNSVANSFSQRMSKFSGAVTYYSIAGPCLSGALLVSDFPPFSFGNNPLKLLQARACFSLIPRCSSISSTFPKRYSCESVGWYVDHKRKRVSYCHVRAVSLARFPFACMKS